MRHSLLFCRSFAIHEYKNNRVEREDHAADRDHRKDDPFGKIESWRCLQSDEIGESPSVPHHNKKKDERTKVDKI